MAKPGRRKPRYEREQEARDRERSRLTGTRLADGRIMADLSRQAPENPYGHRPDYYQDYEFRCRDCGQLQVWTAEQQKWWYEVAKGPIYSMAVRCRECRAALRASGRGTPRRSWRDRGQDVEG